MAISEETELHRVPTEDDPDRCQGHYNGKRCWFRIYIASDGVRSRYCIKHNPRALVASQERSKRNYYLGIWTDRVNVQADSKHVKSIREEIGILRVIMEEIFGKCKDTDELLLNSPRIIDLVKQIKDTVNVCHALEHKTKFLLDKNSIIILVEQILAIISEHVTDQEILAKIADGMEKAIVASQEIVNVPMIPGSGAQDAHS